MYKKIKLRYDDGEELFVVENNWMVMKDNSMLDRKIVDLLLNKINR